MKVKIILLVVFLLFSVTANAEINCDLEQLQTGQKASRYLNKYRMQCSKVILFGSEMPVQEGQKMEWNQMLPNWFQLAEAFSRLANQAEGLPIESDISAVAKRAKGAANVIAEAQDADSLLDISLPRNSAWKLSKDLFLKRIHDQNEVVNFKQTIDRACEDVTSEVCKRSIKLGKPFMSAWKKADFISQQLSEGVLKQISGAISNKDEVWYTFLYDSKPMYPQDLFMTDLMNKQWYSDETRYGEGFPSPPRTQYFFLHPSFAVENVASAADGEEMKPVFYLELFGANRWNPNDRWIDAKYLRAWSGFSLIASYADRAGIKEVGYGGLFTFDNVYSIGITDYDGETGFFISIDLANLWREKYKSGYEKYKSFVKYKE
jgi:hypothetical protein